MTTADNNPHGTQKVAHETQRMDKAHEEARGTGPLRATGPLDEVLPWVLELRVVGTTSILHVRVSEYMTIGRSDPEKGVEPDINLAPYGGHVLGVSRHHALIMANNDRISIRDMGSSNGTRLNGYLLNAGDDYRLRHGDELTFGQLQVQVFFVVVPLLSESIANVDTVIPKLGSGQHILIVEDDADVASVFGMILEHAGFQTTIMNNALSAMAYINQKMPDAMILDLMLPDMDGMELAYYVRKMETDTGNHIPIVVVSGVTGGFQMNQALKGGADVFLGKPVGVDELVKTFAALVPQMALRTG